MLEFACRKKSSATCSACLKRREEIFLLVVNQCKIVDSRSFLTSIKVNFLSNCV